MTGLGSESGPVLVVEPEKSDGGNAGAARQSMTDG